MFKCSFNCQLVAYELISYYESKMYLKCIDVGRLVCVMSYCLTIHLMNYNNYFEQAKQLQVLKSCMVALQQQLTGATVKPQSSIQCLVKYYFIG